MKNATAGTFVREMTTVETRRRDGSHWVLQRRGDLCFLLNGQKELPSTTSFEVHETDEACNVPELPPGDYEQSVRLAWRPSLPAWETYRRPVLVHEVFDVKHSFNLERAIQSGERHVLPDVSVDALTLAASTSGSGEFQANLTTPDGGVACVCRGTQVGREGLIATAFESRGLVLRDLDGGSTEIGSVRTLGRAIGDFPPSMPLPPPAP